MVTRRTKEPLTGTHKPGVRKAATKAGAQCDDPVHSVTALRADRKQASARKEKTSESLQLIP